MWWYGHSNASVMMRDLSFNLIVMVIIMIVIYYNNDNGDDNDWWRQLWRWNGTMEHACMALALIMNRKDFEQAYTVGY